MVIESRGLRSRPVTVVHADGSEMVLESFRKVVGNGGLQGIRLLAQANTAEDAIAKARLLQPDLVITGMRMALGDNAPSHDTAGLQICKSLTSKDKMSDVMILTTDTNALDALRSIGSGAAAFVDKMSGAAAIGDAIHMVTHAPQPEQRIVGSADVVGELDSVSEFLQRQDSRVAQEHQDWLEPFVSGFVKVGELCQVDVSGAQKTNGQGSFRESAAKLAGLLKGQALERSAPSWAIQ